ncbi:hypothetical protein ACJX0J_035186 [Zea mays]
MTGLAKIVENMIGEDDTSSLSKVKRDENYKKLERHDGLKIEEDNEKLQQPFIEDANSQTGSGSSVNERTNSGYILVSVSFTSHALVYSILWTHGHEKEILSNFSLSPRYMICFYFCLCIELFWHG